MFAVDASYGDNLDYDIFPANPADAHWYLADDGYNSNSYISGFIDAAGFRNKPLPPANVPGWDKPVPLSEFNIR